MSEQKKPREFWIYRDLKSGSCHFSTTPIKDSNDYEFMNHLVEYAALTAAQERIRELEETKFLEKANNLELLRKLVDVRSSYAAFKICADKLRDAIENTLDHLPSAFYESRDEDAVNLELAIQEYDREKRS